LSYLGGLIMLVLFWGVIVRLKRAVITALGLAIASGVSQRAARGGASTNPEANEASWHSNTDLERQMAVRSGDGSETKRTRHGEMNFGTLIKDLVKRSADGQKVSVNWEDVRATVEKTPLAAHFGKLRKWLEEPVVSSGAGSAKPQRGRASEPRPSRTQTPREKPARSKVVYKTPSTNPVQAGRRLPKQGRSTLLSGLLAGPWR
jgi:hypothetical protein